MNLLLSHGIKEAWIGLVYYEGRMEWEDMYFLDMNKFFMNNLAEGEECTDCLSSGSYQGSALLLSNGNWKLVGRENVKSAVVCMGTDPTLIQSTIIEFTAQRIPAALNYKLIIFDHKKQWSEAADSCASENMELAIISTSDLQEVGF